MSALSRRKLLAATAMTAGSSLIPAALRGVAKGEQPTISLAERKSSADALMKYFSETAPQLLRPAVGILKWPSIAPSLPGKEYSTSLWDWDTLWTTRGLFRHANLAGNPGLHAEIAAHARGSLMNFLDHQSPEGRLPIMMSGKDPDPFDCLKNSSPNSRNQAKPVFGQLALLIADEMKTVDWLAARFDQLLRFYDAWTLGNQSSLGLLVWGNDVAIGDDNDPTTFGRPFFSSANLMLNCLFYADLSAAATLAQRLGRPTDEQRLSARASELATKIEQFCWDPRDKFYYTVDVQCVDMRAALIPRVKAGMNMSWNSLPIRVQMFTGFLPMWCSIASQEHAGALVDSAYRADDRFRAESGVRSLSNLETMYSLAFSSNPSNWLGPVWIIVNYLVWKGLRNYGFTTEASELADKTIQLLAKDLVANGSLNEYYHPDTGAALSHKGFIDWNLLVLEMI
jgi:putative isomerase